MLLKSFFSKTLHFDYTYRRKSSDSAIAFAIPGAPFEYEATTVARSSLTPFSTNHLFILSLLTALNKSFMHLLLIVSRSKLIFLAKVR